MSAGPATRMNEALQEFRTVPEGLAIGEAQRYYHAMDVLESITTATLEAMDAAAEVMASPIPGLHGGRPLLDLAPFLDGTIQIAHGSTRMTLTEPEADVLLALLLRSRLLRRKEAGNG